VPEFNSFLFWLGVAGGALPDLLRFVKGRHEGFPAFFTQVGYWVALLFLLGLGGLAAWLGGAETWKSAIAMGFTAPEVLSRLFSSGRAETHGHDGFPVRRWWAA
jgi:hypothetical protein